MISFAKLIQRCQPSYGIAYGYVPRRSPFDKTQYIENYIPRQLPYPKSRRPRLSEWDEESKVWPTILPSPVISRKKLLKQIEDEEVARLQLIKPLVLPDFRVGDVVEFKWVHNMSEPNMNVYQGLIVARRNKNSLEGSFKIIFRFCGVEVFMNVKQYSPFMREFRILKRGSGNIRNKQAIWRHTLTKQYLLSPIIRGRSRQRRNDPPRRFSKLQKLNYTMQKIKDPLLQE